MILDSRKSTLRGRFSTPQGVDFDPPGGQLRPSYRGGTPPYRWVPGVPLVKVDQPWAENPNFHWFSVKFVLPAVRIGRNPWAEGCAVARTKETQKKGLFFGFLGVFLARVTV
jgi:hypothetical protein